MRFLDKDWLFFGAVIAGVLAFTERGGQKKEPVKVVEQASFVAEKGQDWHPYIKRFEATAKQEAQKYGIPASVSMAQAICESSWGTSRLTVRENNHFGIKCFHKGNGCGCQPYMDNGKRCRFVRYATSWESWRGHSEFLKKHKRYRHCFKYSRTDWRNWCDALDAAGYSEKKGEYAANLKKIIRKHQLYRLDGA